MPEWLHELKAIMMSRVAYLLLFSYLLMIIRPVLPVLADTFAHTFCQQRHILLVHEVNGKFHVHQEVVKASKQSEKEKQGTVKIENTDNFYTGTALIFSYHYNALPERAYTSYTCFYPLADTGPHYLPPKV